MQGLKDKVVVVAGAATGLGAASAQRLAAEGARVVVGDVDQAGAEQTAAAIRSFGGDAVPAGFDISSDDSVRDLLASMVAYLMSDEGSWINGQVINIDGGRVMR